MTLTLTLPSDGRGNSLSCIRQEEIDSPQMPPGRYHSSHDESVDTSWPVQFTWISSSIQSGFSCRRLFLLLPCDRRDWRARAGLPD
jgi:hypothetical protein